MRPDAELGAQLQALLKGTRASTPPLERATAAAVLLKERATFVDDMLEGTYLFTSGSPVARERAGQRGIEEALEARGRPSDPGLHRALSRAAPTDTVADLEPRSTACCRSGRA
jgi:hypothetical protein